MLVSPSCGPFSDTYYWGYTQVVLDDFVVELKQSSGADIFYFTPFTSRDVWTQLRRDTPLYHEGVILTPSIEQPGDAANGFLLSPVPVLLGAPKLPALIKRPSPTSSPLHITTMFGPPALVSSGVLADGPHLDIGTAGLPSKAGAPRPPPPQIPAAMDSTVAFDIQ